MTSAGVGTAGGVRQADGHVAGHFRARGDGRCPRPHLRGRSSQPIAVTHDGFFRRRIRPIGLGQPFPARAGDARRRARAAYTIETTNYGAAFGFKGLIAGPQSLSSSDCT